MSNAWQVLFIGGSAGAGKTTTAGLIAAELGCSWLQADSTWLALRAAGDFPQLHLFRGRDGLTPELLVERMKAAAETVCRALEPTLPFELEARDRFVIEGSWLIPSFAARQSFAGKPVRTRAVYIHEPDPAEVLRAMKSRSNDPATVTPSQAVVAEGSWLFGQWLKPEAESRGLPVIPARPHATLAARTLAAASATD